MTKNGVCWKGGEKVTPRIPRYVNTSLGVVAGFGRECRPGEKFNTVRKLDNSTSVHRDNCERRLVQHYTET